MARMEVQKATKPCMGVTSTTNCKGKELLHMKATQDTMLPALLPPSAVRLYKLTGYPGLGVLPPWIGSS
ncbi:hypothetical protein Y1Q_0022022 [Alligator mississippiensis]|uniref:Uncharacterized protein n=1 Tax=Alligator mississippiensis TaxID=8496 RepID=A0A151NLR6_ALLMI|nr:hypothetical protein Y1Q_0022022 [Alligator mississippiensis]